jgi:hypothetical protein
VSEVVEVWEMYGLALIFYINEEKRHKLNKNILQSRLVKVGSNLGSNHNINYSYCNLYDVYSVYQTEKHYLLCLGNVQKKLENLAFSVTNLGLEKPKKVQYQAITSYDVFADCQASLHHEQSSETGLEKLGVAFGFTASILIVCFSVFVVF